MFLPILGRHLVHSMVIFYTALVCTSIFQTSLLSMSIPQIKTDWFPPQAFDNSVFWKDGADANNTGTTRKALALLYPPGIVGGYRNQVMRLVGFLQYAKRQNVDEILLPTMLWTTTYKAANDAKRFFPVPMDFLFDVDHWNSYSDHLPLLVDSIDGSDCWEESTIINSTEELMYASESSPSTFVTPMASEILKSSALLSPVKNISHQILTGSLNVQTRKLDLLAQVENCTHPIVYGGGRGAGRLWNDYLRMPKAQPGMNETDIRALEASELISFVSKALRPAKKWREVAHQCVKESQLSKANAVTTNDLESMAPYIALHPRVETDMMVHRCSKNMEKNLTTIFEMVESFKEHNKDRYGEADLQGIFVAVSRHGMQQKTKDESVQTLLQENWITLNSSVSRRTSNFFECGEEMMQRWYSSQPDIEEDYYGSLLPAILNFYIATQATVFIGVSKSSFSNDVWTTRYFSGRGNSNFEYTRTGISPIPNGGLPPPHGNC